MPHDLSFSAMSRPPGAMNCRFPAWAGKGFFTIQSAADSSIKKEDQVHYAVLDFLVFDFSMNFIKGDFFKISISSPAGEKNNFPVSRTYKNNLYIL